MDLNCLKDRIAYWCLLSIRSESRSLSGVEQKEPVEAFRRRVLRSLRLFVLGFSPVGSEMCFNGDSLNAVPRFWSCYDNVTCISQLYADCSVSILLDLVCLCVVVCELLCACASACVCGSLCVCAAVSWVRWLSGGHLGCELVCPPCVLHKLRLPAD